MYLVTISYINSKQTDVIHATKHKTAKECSLFLYGFIEGIQESHGQFASSTIVDIGNITT